MDLDTELLLPFLMTPRQVSTPLITDRQLETFLFYTNLDKSSLKIQKLTRTVDYITYGEQKKFPAKKGVNRGTTVNGVKNLPSFKGHYQKNPNSWYCLKKEKNGDQSAIKTNIFFRKSIIPHINSCFHPMADC